MKMDVKKFPKTVEELEKIILPLQQEIKQEVISYKERYVRLLEESKSEKSRLYFLRLIKSAAWFI